MIPIKSPREIDKMREACAKAAGVLSLLTELVAPGVTTGEIDATAARYMAEAGCKSAFLGYRKFPGNICISLNEEVVHGIGGARKIQYGDIVKMDVGVVYDGWIGDTAITVPCGVIDPKTERLLQTTERILNEVLEMATDGRRLGDLCAFIEEQTVAAGYSVVREFVGHGVGKKLHEEPQIPNYGRAGTGPRLKSGMTLAIEPMINLGKPSVKIRPDNWTVYTTDGLPSAHFEHTVLVRKDKPEVLTWRGKTLLK
ncbi:MAG: type I methionyl aminopeptidase [Chthoniobacterales bacterium]